MTGPDLRRDREEAGISQEALAGALGVTRPYISQIENRLRITDRLRRRYLMALAGLSVPESEMRVLDGNR